MHFFIKYFVKLEMYIAYYSVEVFIAKLPRNAVHYKLWGNPNLLFVCLFS